MAGHEPIKIDPKEFDLGNHWFSKLPLFGGVLGVLGLVASVGLALSDKEQFFFSYHVAFLYFLSIALGAFFFVIVQFAAKAGWSVLVRRIAENLAGTLPYFLILGIPIFLGAHSLFHHWMDENARQTDFLVIHKAPYLNEPFFYARTVTYFVVWAVLSYVFRRRSIKQDLSGDISITKALQNLSYPSIALFAITVTFASVDWIMTMDPHWYSTMFGVYYFAGAVVAIYASLILASMALQCHSGFGKVFNVEHFHDLGKLMFGHTAFWAYIAFSQYFLIWYANIPEETLFFKLRSSGSWFGVSVALAVGHFVIPFLFLLPATMKRRRGVLMFGAAWMLIVHLLDIYWLVMPVHSTGGVAVTLLDVTTFVGVGGVFLALFGLHMKKAKVIPTQDPRVRESLVFQNIV